jgi:hypothetical protein
MKRVSYGSSDPVDDPERANLTSPLDWARLVLTAAWRRKLVLVLVFLAGVCAVFAYDRVKTPVYRVEAKVLAMHQQALPSVVRPVFEDLPARSAWETIHRRESLAALVRGAKLLPADHVRQEARDRSAPRTAEDPLEKWITVLDKKLLVNTEDGAITISIDWPDPQQAYDLVRGALQSFLDTRRLQEVTAIEDMMSILHGRAAALRADLDSTIDEARRGASQQARVRPPRARQPSEEAVRLRALLDAKQRAIQDVEELRRRRLAELQSQLDQARTTLSDLHPTVVGLRKDIEAASRESPQVAALREDERKIRKEYADRMAREGFLPEMLATPPPIAQPDLPPRPDEDQRVRQARYQYEQLMSRLNSTQLELEAAQAAFKYRYKVVWPPQLPTEPVSPNSTKIMPVGILASLLLAIAAAAARDLLRGIITQRWQLERSLGLDVLGEIDRDR